MELERKQVTKTYSLEKANCKIRISFCVDK